MCHGTKQNRCHVIKLVCIQQNQPTSQHLLKEVNPSARGAPPSPFHEDLVSVVWECRLQLPHTIQGNKTRATVRLLDYGHNGGAVLVLPGEEFYRKYSYNYVGR